LGEQENYIVDSGFILQTQDLGTSQEKESYIRINTRELNEVLSIGLSTLYTLD